jgi:hypothetical protein
MWWQHLFKPTKKVGETKVFEEHTPTSLADRLNQLCTQVPVDVLFKSPVIRRFLLTLHWSDIQMLFDAVLYRKKDTPTVTAVNIHTYFKAAGTPPSVCLERVSQMLRTAEHVPHTVSQDVEQLIVQLQEANAIHLSQLKDPP